jgi:hypothetical protein
MTKRSDGEGKKKFGGVSFLRRLRLCIALRERDSRYELEREECGSKWTLCL